MKIRRTLLFITITLNLIIISACGDKAARTVEYFDTHEAERSARIEECKKMEPTDRQTDKDCQAAIMSWSKSEHKRLKEGLNTPQPKSKGFGLKEIR